MPRDFFSSHNLGADYLGMENDLRLGLPTAVFGVAEAHKALIAASCVPGRIVYVTADAQTAARAAAEIAGFTGEAPVLLPAKDEVLLYKDAVSRDALFRRMAALHAFRKGARILVCDVESLLQLFPEDVPSLRLEEGKETDFSSLPARLVRLGYVRSATVEGRGSFALRGDILDIFPVNAENPVRVDFFGDEAEKIKPYDFVTGERLSLAKSVEIAAATDVFFAEGEEARLKDALYGELSSFKDPAAYERAQAIAGEISAKMEAGAPFGGASFLLPLLGNSTDFASFFGDVLYLFDECKAVSDRIDALEKEHEARFAGLKRGGEAFSFSRRQLLTREEFCDKLEKARCAALQTFASRTYFFDPLKIYNLHSTPAGRYLNGFVNLVSDVRSWRANKYRVMLYCGNASRAQKMRELLFDEGIPVQDCPASLELLKGVAVLEEELPRGIVLHEQKLAVIGTSDLYTKATVKKRIRRRRNDMFTSPEVGDYAVHETHGIGRITGTKKIETTDGTKEYIALEYRGGDVLYVPVEQMDILSRYTGEESPALSKIGGAEFEKVKQRVKASLKAMAFDLRKLYAARAEKKGFVFSPHEEEMAEFAAAFDYEETPDQLSSVEEILSDMCSPKVMDRLLCGDVGYGKTEVALRAAYLCVLNGKQAALMCPNTILCRQHFETAAKRFADFGVNVEMLNRFKTPREQEQTLARLAAGKVDLLVGTHRLLSSDVKFSDLGLLILDEEQRFGVEHKEKIKNMKNDVDCLTMTATPIPRTLHMSLSGIRDISTIDTPPTNRLPVQTYVVEETETLIRDACVRELARGGQVFILYNRVESIYSFAAKIEQIVPEGKICVAHGRMDKNVLENGILGFYEGKTDILVTTTIIENGIDLPRANTLIVIDADRLGISQLYQLRGRVGRGSVLAHAYFTFKPEKVMTETATKRLQAIMEFTELGSGFKIAMRDLEIRGAGSVLGREQHGHMDKVGYELYAKLLKEELTGEEQTVADLDIKADAFIPESYIEASASRLDCYKQIAEIRSLDDYKRVCLSMEENYGRMPPEVLNLLVIAVLKSYAAKFNIRKISVSARGGMLELPSVNSLADKRLSAALDRYAATVRLEMSKAPSVAFAGGKDAQAVMLAMTKFLRYAENAAA